MEIEQTTSLKYMMTRYKLNRREARKVLKCKEIAKKIYQKKIRKLASKQVWEFERSPMLCVTKRINARKYSCLILTKKNILVIVE